jgi:NadR type nicotinamide-nucleotide adenylyltransferase
MREVNRLRKIVVTGPESTGKTDLTKALALRLNAKWIPEYARSYVEGINRPYRYNDLEIIARYQIEQETTMSEKCSQEILLMDTWLIITKIWFEVVYGSSPEWIDEYISTSEIDLFLVCKPDLPWIADPVRENGGEMRQKLFDRYCQEIERHGFAYEIVDGYGEQRLANALKLLKTHHIG